MIAHVFLAEPGAGAFERTFKADSEFAYAGRIELDDENDDPFFALDVVFAICNSYLAVGLWEEEMHADEQYRDQVAAYRAGGHRSLSMGDVVAIGEGFYFCASSGWDFITEPSANLMTAFLSAHDHVKES